MLATRTLGREATPELAHALGPGAVELVPRGQVDRVRRALAGLESDMPDFTPRQRTY
jgi:hypothetical protein